jgi:hypothetical protein
LISLFKRHKSVDHAQLLLAKAQPELAYMLPEAIEAKLSELARRGMRRLEEDAKLYCPRGPLMSKYTLEEI